MAASERSPSMLDGVLLIDKPAGLTSAGVVRDVKRRLGGPKFGKVGHLGTLDPFATGLLPLALGEASKIVPFLNQENKAYTGSITLGRATNTLDSTGETTAEAEVPELTVDRIEAVASRFRGDVEQVPPMFSALKRDGERLYDLARKGVELELEPRKVRIDTLELALADSRTLEISVRCSKGTYVRSLARDLATALGTVGHLSALRRTAFGQFEVSRAIPLEALDPADLRLIGLRDALTGLRELDADAELVEKIRRGQQYALASLPTPRAADRAAKVVGPGGALVAMLETSGAGWRIARVFA